MNIKNIFFVIGLLSFDIPCFTSVENRESLPRVSEDVFVDHDKEMQEVFLKMQKLIQSAELRKSENEKTKSIEQFERDQSEEHIPDKENCAVL